MRKFFSLITALVLCTAMWGDTYKTFYKVQGALYQGINVDFTTNKNMFVPNGATVTYSTFDGKPADWYNNGNLKKSGVSSYTASNLADGNYYKYQIKNYTGYDAQDPKIDYMYGTVDNKNYFLRAGSGTMYMMSMANAYCVCTESTTASNVGKYYVDNKSMLTLSADDSKTYGTSMKYGTNFSYAKNGGLIFAYEMLLDNPGEMYIDYIVLPIYGSPKTDATTIDKMIPEGKELTLTLYSIDLTLASDGKYSYTRKTPAIASVKATADNFTASKSYNGTVKFTLDEPLLISGDFVARLTWDDGCEFGLITDDTNLQNFTTFYLWKDDKGSITKSYFWSSSSANATISYHAMFPTLEKKDTKTALEFTHEGGGDEVAIKSNIDPAKTEDFTIDFGGADWISLDSLRYTTEGEYKPKETVYVVFKAEANEGEAREATITLKHHGKELTYTVKQEAAPASTTKTIYCKMEQGWWKADGAAVGCHTWGNPGPGTDWPGVRMTPVEGQTDLWSIELDLNKVQNVIFTRVNPSGAIADWGAKTKDLTIPTGDDNLFTITSATAVWGDPGCEGEWSVYNAPVVTEPTITDITITGDKYVGKELIFAATVAGFSADPTIIYEVKAGEGEYEQAQGGKFTPAAAGDYTVKATAFYLPEDGDSEEAFKEVKFTVTEEPKVGIVVNVTVPDGTPACFFYGEMSNNTFAEMTKVDATHYTIEFPTATTIGWGYLFAWEEGNWNTKNADPEGDIKVEPVEGVINVEIKAWVTAPGTEYKYTTYTEWQVKFGPAWEWVNTTKQEDGTFTVEAVWGNTGINIASGENPIKKDWYPLDDAALTVAEDVAEGDNVVITLTVVDDETVALNVKKQKATNLNNLKAQDGKRYNILGQPVNETYRGIVIMNGQTYLQ